MFRVFVGLGSNVGNRMSYLTKAVDALASVMHVSAQSSVYETEPVGYKDQPEFFNMVVEGATGREPRMLLEQIKHLEKRVGREHNEHMKPREIDIDILLYEGLAYRDEEVSVPHPELENRRFVLEPFAEIAPDVKHPVHGRSVSEMLSACGDTSSVVRVGQVRLPRAEKTP